MRLPQKSLFKIISLSILTIVVAILSSWLLPEGYLSFADTQPSVWVVSSQNRIGIAGEPKNITDIQLYAARGESESFQIAIKATKKNLSNVNVTFSELEGAEGQVIPSNKITAYREHYVYVAHNSSTSIRSSNRSLGKGWYPDGLIPFVDPNTGRDLTNATLDAVPFDLKADRNQAIWVDIFVPRDAAPGKYQGTFTVSSNEGTTAGKILLTVWDFELPLKPSLNSAFLLWEQNDKNSVVELLKHKLMPVTDINPADQRELIDEWGLSSLRLPFWSGAGYHNCVMTAAPSVEEIQKAARQHQSDLLLYVYPVDEIDDCPHLFEELKQWGKNIQRAGVENLVVMKPIPELYDVVDIWVVDPKRYVADTEKVVEVLEQGDRVWFYTFFNTDGYSPKWLIDFEPINFRIPHGFINQSLGLTGALYWRVDLWTKEPWNNVDTYFDSEKDRHYPGEGMLVYPGETVGVDGVVPSMRLKWMRDGVEDYEYIEILKNLGEEDWALAISHSVGKDWENWTRNPQQLETARIKLGNKIEQIYHHKI
jgi:hypothetical protein